MRRKNKEKPIQKGRTLKDAKEFLNRWANEPDVTPEDFEATIKGTGLSRSKLMWRMSHIMAYRAGEMGILTIKAKQGEALKRSDGSFDTSHLPSPKEQYLSVFGTLIALTE